VNNLYYTLATLPQLIPSGPAPFATMDAFWDYVAHVPADWRTQFEGSASDPTVKAYRDWDRSLRVELARVRLENLPWKDQGADLPFEQSIGGGGALDLLDQETPLETEKALDSLRWSFLDDLAQDHGFDRVAFFVYALKLELVQRRTALVRDRGQEAFDGLHARVLAQTNLSIPTGEQS
jgi:Protein of unknown function (DUF2764)